MKHNPWFLKNRISHAKDLAKPFRLAASARVSQDKVNWLPLHTVMPFDYHESLDVRPDKLSLKDVAAFSFLIRFGRPLYAPTLSLLLCKVLTVSLQVVVFLRVTGTIFPPHR